MKLFLRGRITEDDVILHYMNGAAVGELNHSRKFPAAFRPFLCTVITQRVKKFVCTLLLQNWPPTCSKHQSRHISMILDSFWSCVTVAPGAEDLLQVISLGQPIVKGHKGIDMAKYIKEGVRHL